MTSCFVTASISSMRATSKVHVLCPPDGFGIRARDHAQIGLRVAGMGLDLVPDPELRLGRPDGDHFGAGVTGDHRGLSVEAGSRTL